MYKLFATRHMLAVFFSIVSYSYIQANEPSESIVKALLKKRNQTATEIQELADALTREGSDFCQCTKQVESKKVSDFLKIEGINYETSNNNHQRSLTNYKFKCDASISPSDCRILKENFELLRNAKKPIQQQSGLIGLMSNFFSNQLIKYPSPYPTITLIKTKDQNSESTIIYNAKANAYRVFADNNGIFAHEMAHIANGDGKLENALRNKTIDLETRKQFNDIIEAGADKTAIACVDMNTASTLYASLVSNSLYKRAEDAKRIYEIRVALNKLNEKK